jgi:hypothetical protein
MFLILDPLAAATRAVAAIAPLGDDALQAHDARLPEHDRAVGIFDVLRQPDAGVGQELRQLGAAARPRFIWRRPPLADRCPPFLFLFY